MPDQYKLPTDIESRLQEYKDLRYRIAMLDTDRPEIVALDALDGVDYLIATEQVTLLKWFLGEIGEDEPDHSNKYGVEQLAINYRNARKQELRAKVQAKLREYKV